MVFQPKKLYCAEWDSAARSRCRPECP
jgi:hypothetical protein